MTLPTRKCLNENEHQMATYVEGLVAAEMLSTGETSIQPDWTARAKVGSIGAALVSTVEGKFRALCPQRIGSGTQESWATVISQMLKRLSTASSSEIPAIWQSVKVMVSDLCNLNKQQQ
jgi:hypothetical protein